MKELLVVGFNGSHRAAEVLDQLLDLNADWTINLNLHDAVAVYRTKGGRLRVDKSVQPTTDEGTIGGGLLGGLIGALLTIPFTGGASAAVAAGTIGAGAVALGATGAVVGYLDADEMKEKYGISEDFVHRVGGMVQYGQSALFILAESHDPAEIAKYFAGYGGTILRTTLPEAQAKRLQEVIAR